MEMMVMSKKEERHIRQLRVFSFIVWSLSALLLYLAARLPLFDSSPELLLQDGKLNVVAGPLLRWDAFHFGHIAREGYVYEHEWAFFPGTPFIMQTMAQYLRILGLERDVAISAWSTLLIAGALGCCFTSSVTTLYRLTLHHTGSPTVAYLAALLSLIPTSPVALRLASYSEPFFTYLSYEGMMYCTRSQWFWAACCFALAGTFRSNGFILSGFILWGLLVDPILKRESVRPSQVVKSVLFTAMTFVPFIAHQYTAYMTFCSDNASPALWCTNTPPSIYTYVQSKYWNVGFLRYWTLSQIPNFLMCAPVLALLLWFTTKHIQQSAIPRLLELTHTQSQKSSPPHSPFLSQTLNPHAIHAFIMTVILLFASHTQIVLRQAASMPITYWAAACLLMEKPRWGKWWVDWSVVWGAVSIVLWATFLPPA